jgi:hypothetical protein
MPQNGSATRQRGTGMTFEELDMRFPNGFVDAEITGLGLDYQDRIATLSLNLRGNSPDSANSQEYKRAVLTLQGFYYVSIDPPDSAHLFHPDWTKITVDGLPEDPQHFPLYEQLKPTLQVDAFYCRFFVHDWNSFIHLAAKSAQFSWDQG